MPLQLPSLQPASGIQPVNAVPVELVYGPYSGADIASAKQAALDATVNRRYFGMMVGLNVNGVGFVYYFKDLNTLEPIGGGETGPQGFTGPQGQTGPAGAGAAATLVVPFGTVAGGIDVNQVSFQHVFGTKPLVQVYDVTGRNSPVVNATIDYIDVTDTQITVQFTNDTSGYVVVGGGLSGPQGNTGPQGATGDQGPKGPTGEVLYVGQQGPTGIQGFTGPQGVTGVQGFTGPQGNTGIQGFTGPQGRTGVQGFTGPQGFTGNQGVTGPQGRTGVQGFTGPQGVTGVQGFTGPQGHTGIQGYTGPQGGTGADGAVVSLVQTIVQWTYAGIIPMTNVSGKFKTNSDQFNSAQQFQFHKNDIATVSYANWFDQLNTFVTNGNPSYLQVYDAITASNTGLYKVNSVVEGGFTYSIFVDTPPIVSNGSFNIGSVYNVTWVANGTIGATGASGLQGFTGPQGFTGNQGVTGPQGNTGIQGFTGPQGFTGNQGPTGPQGFTGVQGSTGPQGATGMNWKGTYDGTSNYLKNDVVYYFGSSYIATNDVNANTGGTPSIIIPTPTASWNLVSQVGYKAGQVWEYDNRTSTIPYLNNAFGTGSFGIGIGKVHFNSTTATITKMFISKADMSSISIDNFVPTWQTGDVITWTIAATPFVNTRALTLRVGTVSQILGSASMGYYEVSVNNLAGTPGSAITGFPNGSALALVYQPIGPNSTGTGSIGYLPIYTQDNTKFLGTTVSFSSSPTYSSSVYIEATPAGYNVNSVNRSYKIPALYTNVLGSGNVTTPTGDFILNTGDQNITGVKAFRYGHNTSTAVNLDGTWGSVILTELLFRRTMPTFLGSNTSAQFQDDNYRVQKSWVSAFNGTDGGVNTSRGNTTGGPNNSSILNRIIRKTTSNRAFAKTIYTDEIDYYNYGKTTSNVQSSWGNENLRTRLTDWNQVIGRNTTTLIANDVDPYKTVGFSYSQGDPDHIDNFVFNMHVSRMKSATNSTQVDTLLYHWLRGESGFQESTTKKAFYSFTQSTLLFVNPQVGGVNAPNDFATVSSSVGVYTRHDVDNGQIINAYDYFSSRVGNGVVNSKILNHVGYFAQSKTRGTASFDPSGRRTYSFKAGPENWPATYSYQQAPWAFYAEDDKSNLGGGLLINMGATFGTQLNAWLEIQGATASKAQIRLNPATGPSNPGVGDMWFTGDNLYFYDGTNQFDLISEANTGQKGRLGVYPSTGTRLDDEVSWSSGGYGNLGTVSVVLNPITNRDFTEETQAVGYINYKGSFQIGGGGQLLVVTTNYPTPNLILGTAIQSVGQTAEVLGLNDLVDSINTNPLHGYEASLTSTGPGGFTISITAPYSTLSGKYGSNVNGISLTFSGPGAGSGDGDEGDEFIGFSTPFSGGVSVPDITYTIPSNNKSQDFVMTEGNQLINGNKTFSGTVSFTGLITSGTFSYDFESFRKRVKVFEGGPTVPVPFIGSEGQNWLSKGQYINEDYRLERTFYNQNVVTLPSWSNGSYYRPATFSLNLDGRTDGFKILNIAKLNQVIGGYLGLTATSDYDWPNGVTGYSDGLFIGRLDTTILENIYKGASSTKTKVDIANLYYSQNGPILENDTNLSEQSIGSEHTIFNFFKNVARNSYPRTQMTKTDLFIDSVSDIDADSYYSTYSFGVHYRNNGSFTTYQYDFYSSRSNSLLTDTREVGFYVQDKLRGEINDPMGRTYSLNVNNPTYDPWSFFAESDKANFGGGVLISSTTSALSTYEDLLQIYSTGLPAWLTIQQPTTTRPQIKFLPGTPSTAGFGDGEMWYTGTALSFKSEGTIYDLLTSGGGGGAGFQGPTGPSGVNRSDTFSATTSFTVTHNFNTIPVVEVVSGTTFPFDVIIPQSIIHSSVNAYTVTFATTSSGRILTGIGQNGNSGGQGVKGDDGPQGPTGPSELTPIGGPTGSILVRYASGWTAFSATTSTDVYLKSNGYNLPIWATVSGGGGSGDVQTGNFLRIPIYSTDTSGTTLDDVVQSTSIQLASQTGGTKTYTIPNSPLSASFVMTEGTQNIGGTKSFTDQVKVQSNGTNNAQISIEGTNARWINFGNVGFGNPVTSGSRPTGTKLLLVDDTTASAAIGVQQKTTTDTRLWLQGGSAGSVDFYTDNIRVGRIDSATLSLYGRALSFGSPTSSSNFNGRSLTLVMENETLTANRTITVPVCDENDLVIVQKLNPGLTGSETGKAAMVLDAYGSVTRGGEIVSLGVYSLTTTNSINLSGAGATSMSRGTIVPTGGKIIPANWWSVGKVVTGKLVGTITGSNNVQGFTFTLKYGTSDIVTSDNLIRDGNHTNPIEINWMITCRAVGGSGQLYGFMTIKEYNAGGGFNLEKPETAFKGNNSVSTTSDKELDVYVDFSGNGSINIEQVIVEYKN